MQNPLSRNYDSNGPDVKIRGTAAHIAEKYSSLARDALSSGDTVAAENLFQHAEHYNRIIMSAQQQAQADAQPGTGDQPVTNGQADDSPEVQSQDGDNSDRKNERISRSRNTKNTGNGAANNRRRRRRPNGNGSTAKNGSEASAQDENASPQQAPSKPAAKHEKPAETNDAPSNGALL
ncbi:MAG: DUF4167 domain-containing protein [Methyloligellaceae bacterium]